ncbi:PDR/VanB family oxidoreductase [Bordetella sp. BOR01]|uniref:PDR/VanB family oxidoreductase n=1 Tax=Bordetella sp. BOR01 TaxID=2854779 RepID=UPI001C474847|nr:PDR/VanB family oxidoreductase [Bordetella sp. BOR01]MBV7482626.1 PDR/VanB family oxidoreductase [Bordetella sp. BOR01]
MELLALQLRAIRYEAEGVSSFEFRHADGGTLPAFTAGAHIDLHLGNGLVRSYSLCNSPDESHRYVIGVNRDRTSRGGSAFVHERLRVGDRLAASVPRNNFPLAHGAAYSVLVAGGIGITPLWCMAQRLEALGRAWELHYCARSEASAAFLDGIRALAARSRHGRLHPHFDDRMQGRLLDLDAVIAGAPGDAHFYCCGPVAMLHAFERCTAGLSPAQVHVEYFAAQAPASTEGGFKVELARSGKVLDVPAGKTILDVLLEAGVDVPYSCLEGVCATCETRVMAGVPDHRDLVLTKEEQASNNVMMVCCSGSRTPVLVLDR